ncbi:MAG: hypothetical protein FJ387_26335 [Verrucomicrobia bacterium]|nr:hypothetical protein [Verrucomicrobiota bacterium]
MIHRKTIALVTLALVASGVSTTLAQTLLYSNDFSDPSKPLTALNWVTYAFSNQQLVLTCTRNAATDTNNLGTSTGGVEPPPSLFASAVLPDQHTLELRIDLFSANQDGAFADIHAAFNGKGYFFVKDQNEIALLKGWWPNPPASWAVFFWTNSPVKNQNVTLVLALTRLGSDLRINTRVLDKDNANAVLFERTVTDTPQADPVLPNRAVKGILSYPDPAGTPYALQSFGYPVVGVAWVNPQSAPSPLAQVVYDNLEVWQYEWPLSGTRYVNVNNPNPVPPYTTWAIAATNIQDAVDAALPGDEIVVTDGIYVTGSRAVGTNLLVNRVAVDKPLALRSVNGPQVTVIQGHQVPGTTNGCGDGAIRCVYLADGANLSGFTLANGATRTNGNNDLDQSGGGVWCETTNAAISNCVLAANSASDVGGGAYGGTLNHCTLASNRAVGGGGAWESTLNKCTMTGNSAEYGGGASGGTLNNCVLTANSADFLGGGVHYAVLNNCTLTGNSARDGGGVSGGWFSATLNNCIVYFNSAESGANYDHTSELHYCCTTPLPTYGVGNITNAPLFVDYAGGNLRLQSNSPCINAGNNSHLTDSSFTNSFDLDGNPRIVSGTVDIGAYEFQGPGSLISYAWLQQFGLPTDGSADATDPDADGHTTWQEWRCLTDPTNALSGLRLLSATSGGTNVTVRWQSIAGVRYLLERSTDLSASPPFLPLACGLEGQPGATSFTDTNAAFLAPLFYRVGVR